MPVSNDKDDDVDDGDGDGDGGDDDDEGRDRDQHDNKAGGHVKLELRGRTGRCSAHHQLRQQRDSRADRGDDDEEDEDEDKDDYNRFSGNKEIFARIVGMRKMMLRMRMALITKMRMTPMMYKPLTRSHLIGLYNML